MKSCNDCKYCMNTDYGYSNYTVEGTVSECLLNLNPNFPVDRFYGEEPALKYAKKCIKYEVGESVSVDVDCDLGLLENYSEDSEIKELLRRYYE